VGRLPIRSQPGELVTKFDEFGLRFWNRQSLRKQFLDKRDDMDDRYAINLAKSQFREGFNRSDEEMDLSIYYCAFADMSFGLPSFFESDANDVLRARLRRLFHDYTTEMAVLIIDIVLNGDKALDWGWHILKLTNKRTGAQRTIRTRYFETWRRDAERGWIITSFIDNLDEIPRLPEHVIQELEHTTCDSRVTRLSQDSSQFSLPGHS